MKRLLCALLMLALTAFMPALAEADAPAEAIPFEETSSFGDPAALDSFLLPEGEAVSVDLDGDGAQEDVAWSMAPGPWEDDVASVTVGEATFQTEIISAAQAYIVDLDGDGRSELLMSGDVMSDDYYTWCLRYEGGALYEVLFPDAGRGENGEGYFKHGYGEIIAIGDNRLALCGSQDVLGTWFGYRLFTLAPSGHFEFDDEGVWIRDIPSDDDDVWEYAALTLTSALPCYDLDSAPSGTLNPGDRIILYASDKLQYAWFATPDGHTGLLAISPNYEQGWGWLVDGIPEEDCFEQVPYAD